MKINKKVKGFSLIELMVSIGISSFLFAMSAPSYSAWMSNLRIKNIADGIELGILSAKSEAIRRNMPIIFMLDPNTSWSVGNEEETEFYNKKIAVENSETIALDIFPANTTTITFNGFGSIIQNLNGTETLNRVDVSTTSGFAGALPLSVRVSTGGSVFVCVPSVANVTDDRFCKAT